MKLPGNFRVVSQDFSCLIHREQDRATVAVHCIERTHTLRILCFFMNTFTEMTAAGSGLLTRLAGLRL